MKINVIPKKYLKFENYLDSLSLNEKRIFAVLEDDPQFEKAIKLIRRECQIPQEGLNPEEHDDEGVEKYIFERRTEEVINLDKKISKKYYKSLEWYVDLLQAYYQRLNLDTNSLVCLILFNFVLPSVNDPAIRFLSEMELQKQFDDWPDCFKATDAIQCAYIEISHKVQKTELLKFIDEHYDDLNSKLGKINQKENKPLRIKLQNLEKYKKIFHLRKEGKSFSEIADVINDENEEAKSDSEVRVMHHRYKKFIEYIRSKP